tara:strand:+ start:11797 stop:13710 length:1914 start_codon:yes stop_codon:yes gene_type:complete
MAQADSIGVTSVGGHGILGIPGQSQYRFKGTDPVRTPGDIVGSVLDFPGVYWTTMLRKSVVMYSSLAAGDNPLLLELNFGHLGSGCVSSMCPAALATVSILCYSLGNPSSRISGVWHAKRHVNAHGAYVCPAHITSYCWGAARAICPPQVMLFDVYVPRSKIATARPQATSCWSVGHHGASVQLAPFAPFVFQKNMCIACFKRNTKRNAPAAVGPAFLRLHTAKELVAKANPAILQIVTHLFSSLRRCHLIAALDTQSGVEPRDTIGLEQHGSAVEHCWVAFPHVYKLRECGIAIDPKRPAVGLRRYWIMSGGRHHIKGRAKLERLQTAVIAEAASLIMYGRMHIDISVGSPGVHEFMPWVDSTTVNEHGVQPWHEFVRIDGLWMTVDFVHVMSALMNGNLILVLEMLPPLRTSELIPAVTPRGAVNSVRGSPVIKGCNDATCAHRQYADRYHDGAFLTWSWLSKMLRDHGESAAMAGLVVTPPLRLTVAGSYARAVTGVSYRGITYGGVFSELCTLAFQGTIRGLTAEPSSIYGDILNYVEHSLADMIVSTIRLEQSIAASDVECGRYAIVHHYEHIGMPTPCDMVTPPPEIDHTLLLAVANVRQQPDHTLCSNEIAVWVRRAVRESVMLSKNISL